LKPDITSRADIETFITEFYERVRMDPTIGFIFNEVARIDWEKHIPIIVDFWETILLDNPVYKRNAMEVHYDLNKQVPLQKEHFGSWLKLFNETMDDLFEGKKATMAKTRAKGIADVMLLKMNETRR
jgi:hemoglobin